MHLTQIKKSFFFLFSLFLLLFMGLIIIFVTIHESHCTISVTFLVLSIILSTKNFQFQLNKLFPNRHIGSVWIPLIAKNIVAK